MSKRKSEPADRDPDCHRCTGTIANHVPNCPGTLLPAHAADGQMEAIAAIYQRAVRLSSMTGISQVNRRALTEIMQVCRYYLPESRISMIHHEQSQKLLKERGYKK